MSDARVWNRGGRVKVRERHMKEILQISSIINWMVREKGTRVAVALTTFSHTW